MEIDTKRLVLITITKEDLDFIHRLHSIPEVDRYNTLGIPENLDVTRKLAEPIIEAQTVIPRKDYSFKIVLKESRAFIGLAGITLSLDKFRLGEIWHDPGRAQAKNTSHPGRLERCLPLRNN